MPRLTSRTLPIAPAPARPHRNRLGVALSACACLLLCSPLAVAGKTEAGKREKGKGESQSPTPNDVRIETFAPERGYIVGVENVVLLCVVRNTSSAPLPENQLRLRCYPISGLDYTNGNLLPVLPALAPGQAVAYRWRLAPSAARAVLVAGVVLEQTGEGKKEKGETVGAQFIAPATPSAPNTTPAPGLAPTPQNPMPNAQSATPTTNHQPLATNPPQLAFAVIPRLPRPLGLGDTPLLKDPLAHAGELNGSSLLLNQRVILRAQIGERRETCLTLGVKDGNIWRSVANTVGLLRVCVGEEGQRPWWQAFRCQQIRAREDKTSATLTLTGTIGNSCRAEITLESRPDTGVINGRARLTALRSLRLSGIQLPALLTASDDKTLPAPRADGSPSLLPDPPALIADEVRVAAAHNGAATFGIAWPAAPPFPGWKWNRLPLADGLVTSVLGVQATSEAGSDTLSAGSGIEVPFRWFAFAPSDTVRDAERFQMQ